MKQKSPMTFWSATSPPGIQPLTQIRLHGKMAFSSETKLIGEFGQDEKGHEWIRWEKQVGLFDFMASVPYAEEEKEIFWSLPGQGSGGLECGETYAKGCSRPHEHGHDFIRLYRHNCRSRDCPICYESWASRAAENILIRMASFALGSSNVDAWLREIRSEFRLGSNRDLHHEMIKRLEYTLTSVKSDRSRPLKPVHFVISPPNPIEVDSNLESVKQLRGQAEKIAKSRGIHGGCIMPHPYRQRCVKCHSTIPDYQRCCPNCGSSAFEWFWSFHFHVIGFGWLHDIGEQYEIDKWIVKGLGVRKSVFWTAQYILSHAGVSRLYTVTWFGDLAFRALKKTPKLERILELCPYCETPLQIMFWNKGQDRPPPEFDRENPELNEILAEPGDWNNGSITTE